MDLIFYFRSLRQYKQSCRLIEMLIPNLMEMFVIRNLIKMSIQNLSTMSGSLFLEMFDQNLNLKILNRYKSKG